MSVLRARAEGKCKLTTLNQKFALLTNFCSHKLTELFRKFLSIRPAVFPPTLNARLYSEVSECLLDFWMKGPPL
jgi:hypothetical protein